MKRSLLAAFALLAVAVAIPLGCAHRSGCPTGNCGSGGYAAPGTGGYVVPPPGGSAPTYTQPAQPYDSQPSLGGSGTR